MPSILAVLKTDGMMATVMPHGVLFRGGQEREIRQSLIENDHLEAIIGLPPNLFYGTGIPACILVMRAKGAKPNGRKGKVLFINADAEFLDCYKVAGVVASWWDEVQYELKTLAKSGFGGLVDSWVDTIVDALEDDGEEKNRSKFDPLNHKLVVRLLADYLQEIADTEAKIAELEQEKEAFERGEDSEEDSDDDEENQTNFIKELKERQKEIKNQIKIEKNELKEQGKFIKEKQKRVKYLDRGANVKDVEREQLVMEIARLEKELEAAETKKIELLNAKLTAIENQLQPYAEIEQNLKENKAILKTLKNELVTRLQAACQSLNEDKCQKLVLDIFKEGITTELERYVTAHRQQVIATVENCWDKYQVTLQDIERERDEAAKQLEKYLSQLGYR